MSNFNHIANFRHIIVIPWSINEDIQIGVQSQRITPQCFNSFSEHLGAIEAKYYNWCKHISLGRRYRGYILFPSHRQGQGRNGWR